MSKKELATQTTAEVVINPAVAGKSITADGIELVNMLTNVKLAKAVKKYASSYDGVNAKQWDMIDAIGLMTVDDEYKSDFATWSDLAEFLGMSKTTMSLSRKLAQFNTKLLRADGFTVSNAFELTKMPPSEYDTFRDTRESNPAMLTQKALRQEVKDFCYALKSITDDDKVVRDESVDDTVTDSLTNYDDTSDVSLMVEYDLPTWVSADGGYVSDRHVNLPEDVVTDLAKVITKFLDKYIDA